MKNVKIADSRNLQEKIYKSFSSELKVSDDSKRTLIVKISTPNADRSHDTMSMKGMVYKNYIDNPVVLFAHKYDSKPIAKCVSLQVTDQAVVATVEFFNHKEFPEADVIYEMYKQGYLNAWSIGFMPLEDGYERNDAGGYDFKKWELLEFSSVPVPDNPEALTIMRSKGIDVDLVLEKKAPSDEGKPEGDKPADEGKDAAAADAEKKDEPAEGKDADTKEVKQTLEEANETIKTLQAENEALKKQLEAKATEDTLVSDLSAKQLKELFIPPAVEQKDVSQVTSLAYVLSELQWLAYCFEYDEVSQDTRDKINQAIALILEAIKDQAELGQKSFAIEDKDLTALSEEERAKLLAWSIEKAGRTISARHEEMLKTACDHMEKAAEQVSTVLGSVAAQDDTEGDDEGEKGKQPAENKDAPQEDFLTKLANQLKTSNQQQAAILRNQKEQKPVLDSTLSYLQQLSSEIGGE